MLHAFEKKAKSGRKTDKLDVEAVREALKSAEEHSKAAIKAAAAAKKKEIEK